MSKEDFLSGKPFTAVSTEGSFVFVPTPGKETYLGYIKNARQKESGDMFCVVNFVSEFNATVYCTRMMLGQAVTFDVPLKNFTVVQAKAKKEKEVVND